MRCAAAAAAIGVLLNFGRLTISWNVGSQLSATVCLNVLNLLPALVSSLQPATLATMLLCPTITPLGWPCSDHEVERISVYDIDVGGN